MRIDGFSTLDAIYEREVRAEVTRHPPEPSRTVTDADVDPLPEPLRRYFRASGFVGAPYASNFAPRWQSMQLKRSRRAPWMSLECLQFNGVQKPLRIALMKGKLGRIVPFEGKDEYRDGHGQMLIKLLKVITVADSRGRMMDESGLVTVLSECLLAPSCALQSWVSWHEIDDRTVGGQIDYAGCTVRGTFHLNDDDEVVHFESSDRWQDGAVPRRIPWSASFGEYRLEQGLRYPSVVSAAWHEPGGDFTYVRGRLEGVRLNVTKSVEPFDSCALRSSPTSVEAAPSTEETQNKMMRGA